MYSLNSAPTATWASGDTLPCSVGQITMDYQGRVYRFCQADAGGVTGAGYVCTIESSNTLDMIDTTNSAPGAEAGRQVGVAMAAIAASGYGWVCVLGRDVPVRVAASAAKGTLLNTTATAGQLDDDATAGAEQIVGIALTTANGGAAGNALADVTWPTIGRTL